MNRWLWLLFRGLVTAVLITFVYIEAGVGTAVAVTLIAVRQEMISTVQARIVRAM
jgi:hypothetical protein